MHLLYLNFYIPSFCISGVKMNSLNEEVMADMEAIFNECQSNSSISAVVLISGKLGCFIAGADINMIEKCQTAAEAQVLYRMIHISF